MGWDSVGAATMVRNLGVRATYKQSTTPRGVQKDVYTFGKDDFNLMLKTVISDRYWLDTGVFKNVVKYL